MHVPFEFNQVKNASLFVKIELYDIPTFYFFYEFWELFFIFFNLKHTTFFILGSADCRAITKLLIVPLFHETEYANTFCFYHFFHFANKKFRYSANSNF